MIRKIQRRWFEVWGDEEAQNRLLKYLLLVFALLITVELVTITALAMKKPVIVSIGQDSSKALIQQEPDANALNRELIRMLKQYLRTRHNWDWMTIEAKAKEAARYVASEYRSKFLLNVQEQIRIAKEKQVSQKLFPEEPEIDLKEKKAKIVAERILILNGIRASQPMKFELGFLFGERTEVNPEGIYITSEKLDQGN